MIFTNKRSERTFCAYYAKECSTKFDTNPFSNERGEDFVRIVNDDERRRTPSDGNSSHGL